MARSLSPHAADASLLNYRIDWSDAKRVVADWGCPRGEADFAASISPMVNLSTHAGPGRLGVAE